MSLHLNDSHRIIDLEENILKPRNVSGFETKSILNIFDRSREHLTPTTQENTAAASELLILSLDLVKNRVVVMGKDLPI
jgi:hypothetical protein